MNEKTGVNRAKLYQLALFPMNNGATNVYFVLVLSYVATFGENILGLIGFASIMVAVMRVFDAVTDPIFGSLMDKLNTKFGKFRPFMVVGNLVMASSVSVLYFVTPLIDALWLRYVAFTLLYAIWVIGYTLQTSVTRAGTSVITNDPKQRPLLNIFNAVGAILGMGVTNVLGMVLAGDGFMADYNESWFKVITPIGIGLSMLLTLLAVIGIWHKDNDKYFGIAGGKQEKTKISEYIQIAKANKPLQRLMVAGGGCKLALSIATNITVLCMLYGCMTQFGLGFTQGKLLTNMEQDTAKQIVDMEFDEDSQVLAITLNGDALKYNKASETNKLAKAYKFDSKIEINTLSVHTAKDILKADENGNLVASSADIDVIAFYVNNEGKAAALELDESGMPKGLVKDNSGKILGINTSESSRVIGILVNDEGKLISTTNEVMSIKYDDNGYLSGLKSEDIAQLASRNRYDSLNLLMMVFGYVCSAPFFALSARTAQKHGQKKSLMTYVAFAFLCYIGVFVVMLLWRFGNPAWNFSIYEGDLFGAGFKITINLYTILFLLFFGLGYGAYYATADMPIPMVADCSDYEMYRSGKFIPGIIGTLFSLVDKLVSSLSATVVSVAVGFIGYKGLPTKATPYIENMNWVVIVLFCVVPMIAWGLTLLAMKGYSLDGKRLKVIQAVNAARKEAVAGGMPMEEAMATITDETVAAIEPKAEAKAEPAED